MIRNKTSNEATEDIVENQLPKLKQLVETKQLDVDNIDVFCEKGVYDVEQTRKILTTGQQLANLKVNFHSDELYPLNSVEVSSVFNYIKCGRLFIYCL